MFRTFFLRYLNTFAVGGKFLFKKVITCLVISSCHTTTQQVPFLLMKMCTLTEFLDIICADKYFFFSVIMIYVVELFFILAVLQIFISCLVVVADPVVSSRFSTGPNSKPYSDSCNYPGNA